MQDHQGSQDIPGQDIDLTVIVPAYNEAERHLDDRIIRTLDFLGELHCQHELLVVDDGSVDKTIDILRSIRHPRLRWIRLDENRGKGAAVRAGFLAARGARVLFMDADLATPLAEIPVFLEHMNRGADVVIGSRGMKASVLDQRESIVRENSGKLFNRLAQTLVIPGILDTQCGFKLFRGPIARAVASSLREPRFGFDVELLYLIKAAGFSIIEVPVHWAHQPGSRLRFFRDGVSMLAALGRIAARKIMGGYRSDVDSIRCSVGRSAQCQ